VIAITRGVSASLANCQLSHIQRSPIYLQRARQQHAAYEQLLQELGCTLLRLPPEDHLPDAVFVEDTAVVLDELAVLCRPGASSRREEVSSVGLALLQHRPVLKIEPPATLDGGDVLRWGRILYVGQSQRSNSEGHAQLGSLVAPYGYQVVGVPVKGCLHLKTAVTRVGPDLALLNPDWVQLPGQRFLAVDRAEPMAANALWLGDRVMLGAAFPQTRSRLEQAGIPVESIEADELAKAEGGLTCCSLIFSSALDRHTL